MGDNRLQHSLDEVLRVLPEPRLRPFLDAAQGDVAKALRLYAWNARMAAASWEQLAHLEVLLRNAVDVCIADQARERHVGIPWFLLPPYYEAQPTVIDTVRRRLRDQGRETRDDIIAGLNLGFWCGWFGPKYEDLWRSTLRRVFSHGSGRRKEASILLERVRKFRNRVAHHDSLLNEDIGFEMEAVLRLAGMISPDAASWMRSVDRTEAVAEERPVPLLNTVVVPAKRAWPLYQDHKCHAYVCQAGRFFRQIKHIAFYAERCIQREIPRIRARYDNVVWSTEESHRLLRSDDKGERKLGRVMRCGLENGWDQGVYQVSCSLGRAIPSTFPWSHPWKMGAACLSCASRDTPVLIGCDPRRACGICSALRRRMRGPRLWRRYCFLAVGGVPD